MSASFERTGKREDGGAARVFIGGWTARRRRKGSRGAGTCLAEETVAVACRLGLRHRRAEKGKGHRGRRKVEGGGSDRRDPRCSESKARAALWARGG